MKIGNQEFGRVAILVLDYDEEREESPQRAVINSYLNLQSHLRQKYRTHSQNGIDATVLANEELVAKHENDFREKGMHFFPDWRNSNEYRELLREGLRQGNDIYMMCRIGSGTIVPTYALKRVSESALEITDREGKIDIKPKKFREGY